MSASQTPADARKEPLPDLSTVVGTLMSITDRLVKVTEIGSRPEVQQAGVMVSEGADVIARCRAEHEDASRKQSIYMTTWKHAMEQRTGELGELDKKAALAEAETKSQVDKLEIEQRKLDELQHRIRDANESLNASKRQKEAIESELITIKAEAEHLQSTNAEVKDAHARETSRLQTMEADLQRRRMAISEEEKQVDARSGTLDRWEKRVRDKELNHGNNQSHCDSLKTQLESEKSILQQAGQVLRDLVGSTGPVDTVRDVSDFGPYIISLTDTIKIRMNGMRQEIDTMQRSTNDFPTRQSKWQLQLDQCQREKHVAIAEQKEVAASLAASETRVGELEQRIHLAEEMEKL